MSDVKETYKAALQLVTNLRIGLSLTDSLPEHVNINEIQSIYQTIKGQIQSVRSGLLTHKKTLEEQVLVDLNPIEFNRKKEQFGLYMLTYFELERPIADYLAAHLKDETRDILFRGEQITNVQRCMMALIPIHDRLQDEWRHVLRYLKDHPPEHLDGKSRKPKKASNDGPVTVWFKKNYPRNKKNWAGAQWRSKAVDEYISDEGLSVKHKSSLTDQLRNDLRKPSNTAWCEKHNLVVS